MRRSKKISKLEAKLVLANSRMNQQDAYMAVLCIMTIFGIIANSIIFRELERLKKEVKTRVAK